MSLASITPAVREYRTTKIRTEGGGGGRAMFSGGGGGGGGETFANFSKLEPVHNTSSHEVGQAED